MMEQNRVTSCARNFGRFESRMALKKSEKIDRQVRHTSH
jgi:hypothetical protein